MGFLAKRGEALARQQKIKAMWHDMPSYRPYERVGIISMMMQLPSSYVWGVVALLGLKAVPDKR